MADSYDMTKILTDILNLSYYAIPVLVSIGSIVYYAVSKNSYRIIDYNISKFAFFAFILHVLLGIAFTGILPYTTVLSAILTTCIFHAFNIPIICNFVVVNISNHGNKLCKTKLKIWILFFVLSIIHVYLVYDAIVE